MIMNEAAEMAQRAMTTGENGRIAGQRLCEAAGMWAFIADVELARLARSGGSATLSTRRPVELLDDNVARAMVSYVGLRGTPGLGGHGATSF